VSAGSEHGVLGSRRVDGPTAEVGGKRAGANESASFKTPRYRGKAKVDLQDQFVGAACSAQASATAVVSNSLWRGKKFYSK
jgi:hypothetical protein